jgi:hypothetical protein
MYSYTKQKFMDCKDLEKLYFSESIDDLIRFYKEIDNYNDLLKFSRSIMPTEPEVYIANSNAKNDIIIVAPTPDHFNEDSINLAKTFEQFKIVFVEARGKNFRFSLSMNKGIEKALTYSPNWIILTNIDIYPISNVDNLRNIINNSKSDILVPRIIDEKNKLNELEYIKKTSVFMSMFFRYGYYFKSVLPESLWGKFIIYHYGILKGTSYYHSGNKKVKKDNYSKLIYKNIFSSKKIYYINVQPFSIIKADIVKKEKFDTDFINAFEDFELAIRLYQKKYKVLLINFNIRRGTGTYLGINLIRLIRYHIFAEILLAYKIKSK